MPPVISPLVPRESEIYSGSFPSSLWNCQRKKKQAHTRLYNASSLHVPIFARKGSELLLFLLQISWAHFSAVEMQKKSTQTQRWTTNAICDGRPCLLMNYVSGRRRGIWAHQPPSIWKHESMCDSCNHLSWNVRSRLPSGLLRSIGSYLDILISWYLQSKWLNFVWFHKTAD